MYAARANARCATDVRTACPPPAVAGGAAGCAECRAARAGGRTGSASDRRRRQRRFGHDRRHCAAAARAVAGRAGADPRAERGGHRSLWRRLNRGTARGARTADDRLGRSRERPAGVSDQRHPGRQFPRILPLPARGGGRDQGVSRRSRAALRLPADAARREHHPEGGFLQPRGGAGIRPAARWRVLDQRAGVRPADHRRWRADQPEPGIRGQHAPDRGRSRRRAAVEFVAFRRDRSRSGGGAQPGRRHRLDRGERQLRACLYRQRRFGQREPDRRPERQPRVDRTERRAGRRRAPHLRRPASERDPDRHDRRLRYLYPPRRRDAADRDARRLADRRREAGSTAPAIRSARCPRRSMPGSIRPRRCSMPPVPC